MTIKKITEVKRGTILLLKGQGYQVIDYHRSKPGKGGAYITMVAKHITKNTKITQRYSTNKTVEIMSIHQVKANYSYRNKNQMIFFTEKGDEYTYPYDANSFLEEEMDVTLLLNEDDEIIKVKNPREMSFKVVYASGRDSAASKEQIVELSNGLKIKSPNYVKINDIVVIDGENHTFVRTAQKKR